ncbi:MAG: nucleoside monophosphate kinase [Spirochaetia bacterium]|nr:nucleoside monophosphate kinase [Spirochaetia bacterium]
MAKYKAMLILGSTGAGKTPLGNQLETQDLWYNNYFHFDFGQNLRDSIKDDCTVLTPEEKEKVKRVLENNELLEDSDFPIAEKLLKNFIEKREITPEMNNVIVLNGLPRHLGQATALNNIVDIKFVLFLNCPGEVAYERIKYNCGGDRTDRTDDSLEEVKKKVQILYDQTFPLIEYYRSQNVNIVEVAVDIDTLPLFIIQDLGVLDNMF